VAESLERLHNRILSDAKLKADGIIEQANEKYKQLLAEAQSQAQKDADEIISKATLEAENLRRSILSSRIRTNRLRLLDEKNRIVQNVVKSVEQQLSQISSANQFQSTLKRLVTEAIEAVGSDNTTVRVGFQNPEKEILDSIGRSLPKGSRLVIESRAIDDLGGVVASNPEGIVFSNTFKARLERLDTQLLSTISSTIFGE